MGFMKHRCDKWKDIQLAPGCSWVLGTCLTYVPAVEKWVMSDEPNETCSIWGATTCPFCGASLQDMLDKSSDSATLPPQRSSWHCRSPAHD